jgi:hypothetical protein
LAIDEVILSCVSYFDAVFIADGTRVYKWDQSNTLNDQYDEFATSNALTDVDDTVNATVTPGGAYLDNYEAHFNVNIQGPCEEGASIVVSAEHGGEEVAEAQIAIPESSLTSRNQYLPHEKLAFEREIGSGETLTLKLKNIVQKPVTRTNDLYSDSGTPLWKVSKSPSREAYGDTYLFSFVLTGVGDSTIGFYTNDGGGWVQQDTFVFSSGASEWPITVDGLGSGSSFGLHVEDGSLSIYSASVEWNEPFDITVHGFNQTTDVEHGVTYQTIGSPSNTLTRVDKDPDVGTTDYLQARYLGAFGNRVLALREGGDLQTIAWSINGDPDDWVGTGSGSSILEGISDPVDELMALQEISSNLAALFRKRSIMKVQLTGSASSPFGFYRWLNNVGTESPFSVAGVPGGVMFLGHDRVVYYLSESEFLPIGGPIQEELEKSVGNLDSVEAAYDPASQEYVLSVPGASGSESTQGWVLDVSTFLVRQQIVWYKRVRSYGRVVSIQGTNLYFTGSDYVTRRYDKLTPASGAYWTSPTLNRKKSQAEYTINKVIVRYKAEGDSSLIIHASGDGGVTWEEGYKTSVDVNETSGQIRRAVQAFDVTGYDLRFKIMFPSDEIVTLQSWEAFISERGELGQE